MSQPGYTENFLLETKNWFPETQFRHYFNGTFKNKRHQTPKYVLGVSPTVQRREQELVWTSWSFFLRLCLPQVPLDFLPNLNIRPCPILGAPFSFHHQSATQLTVTKKKKILRPQWYVNFKKLVTKSLFVSSRKLFYFLLSNYTLLNRPYLIVFYAGCLLLCLCSPRKRRYFR